MATKKVQQEPIGGKLKPNKSLAIGSERPSRLPSRKNATNEKTSPVRTGITPFIRNSYRPTPKEGTSQVITKESKKKHEEKDRSAISEPSCSATEQKQNNTKREKQRKVNSSNSLSGEKCKSDIRSTSSGYASVSRNCSSSSWKNRPTSDDSGHCMDPRPEHKHGKFYKMDNKYRGIFLIFNCNVNGEDGRQGAEKDSENLQRCFSKLGFEVKDLRNNSKEEIFDNLHKCTALTDHSNNDCFGVAILGHGKDGLIYTRDSETSIIDIVKKMNCKALEGKPKMLFIQSCRLIKDEEELYMDAKPVNSWKPNVPPDSDFVLSYATAKGTPAFRFPATGSPYIMKLTEIMEERGHLDSILDILTTVNREVQSMIQGLKLEKLDRFEVRQGPVFESSLSKSLKFDKVVGIFKKYADGRYEPVQ